MYGLGIFGADPRTMLRFVRRTNRLPGDEELGVALLADRVSAVVEDALVFCVPLVECSRVEGTELLRHGDAARDDEGDVSIVQRIQRFGAQWDILLFSVETPEEREGREIAAFEEVVSTGADHDSPRRQDFVDETHGP